MKLPKPVALTHAVTAETRKFWFLEAAFQTWTPSCPNRLWQNKTTGGWVAQKEGVTTDVIIRGAAGLFSHKLASQPLCTTWSNVMSSDGP